MSSGPISLRAERKGCGFLLFGFFAFVGLGLFIALVIFVWGRAKQYSWEPVPCVVTQSQVVETEKGYDLELTYTYQYNGREFTGNKYKYSGNNFEHATDVQRAARALRAGSTAQCFVNPSDPSVSVIRRDTLLIAIILLFPLVFIAIGVGGIIALRRQNTSKPTPISTRQGKRGGAIVLWILGSIFSISGVVATYWLAVRPWMQSRDSANWTKTTCTITSSKVERHRSDEGSDTYSIEVRYRYSFKNEQFFGDSYSFDSSSSSNRGWRAAIVAKLPPGKVTDCYVNPADPVESVLVRDLGSLPWLAVIPIVFLAVGAGMLFGARKLSASPTARITTQPASLRAPINSTTQSGGSMTLRPGSTPFGGCIIAGIFAFIWNGVIIAVLLNNKIEGFGKLFVGIFGLIGVIILAVAFHQFLALFNPRPVLSITATEIRLGDSIDCQLRFTGNVSRIVRLMVTLRAQEVATYRRGTDTVTDKETFVNNVLVDSADPSQFASRQITISIPATSMHSFNASNNKIEWCIVVHGDIPRWPDVNIEFPITVLPIDTAKLAPSPAT